MTKIKKNVKTKKSSSQSVFKNYWLKENYLILGAGLLTILIGYYLMSFSPWDNPASLTISPIILLIAYLLIIPLAIFYRKKSADNKETEDVSGEG